MPGTDSRDQRHTILIVCEGYAEEELVRYIRALYLPRPGTVAVSTQNARGGGGKHVLDQALRIRKRTGFDEFAMLADTDQDWDDAQRRRAKASRIHALESSPCLEAWLLAVNGHAAKGSGAQIKREFERVYRASAHDPAVYPKHFPKHVLEGARSRIDVLSQLLQLLRV
jgi:glycine betaine/choline ABC-type transport system substrate-binding protein